MNRTDITYQRLVNQHILQADQQSVADVVRNLVALQAQDYPGSLWSIALRMTGVTASDIERAIIDRQIVRTWPMRGTLHFVMAEDIRWLLKLLTPRIISGSASRRRNLGLDDAVFAKASEVITAALQGGKAMLRSDLIALLANNGIETANQRGYHILFQLSTEGLICFGPHNAKQPTFVLLDEWIPVSRDLTHQEALAELAQRFFTGHGPATVADLARWSGLPLGEIRKGLAIVESSLSSFDMEGQIYWHGKAPASANLLLKAKDSVVLLSGFDEYILGYKDRSLMLELQHSNKIVPGNNGVFQPTIIIGGQVAGLWKRTVKSKIVAVQLLPFIPLTTKQLRAAEAAAERYGAFLGKAVEVTVA